MRHTPRAANAPPRGGCTVVAWVVRVIYSSEKKTKVMAPCSVGSLLLITCSVTPKLWWHHTECWIPYTCFPQKATKCGVVGICRSILFTGREVPCGDATPDCPVQVIAPSPREAWFPLPTCVFFWPRGPKCLIYLEVSSGVQALPCGTRLPLIPLTSPRDDRL